jgi:hypothetical protein
MSIARDPEMTDLGVSFAWVVVEQGNGVKRSVWVIGQGVNNLPAALSCPKYHGAFCGGRSAQIAFSVEPPAAARSSGQYECEGS